MKINKNRIIISEKTSYIFEMLEYMEEKEKIFFLDYVKDIVEGKNKKSEAIAYYRRK